MKILIEKHFDKHEFYAKLSNGKRLDYGVKYEIHRGTADTVTVPVPMREFIIRNPYTHTDCFNQFSFESWK